MSQHLIIALILLPLAVAALQILAGGRLRKRVGSIAITGLCLLLLLAMALLIEVINHGTQAISYQLGNWPAPFGITLVADRLSALMVVLTSVLALTVLPATFGRWGHHGGFFQPLLQFLVMGFNGVFLTGDLFNLFVFFEILLAASYGLAVYGGGIRRISASMHYITVSLIVSSLFLLGVGLIYNATGTLNMADLAQKVAHVSPSNRSILHMGAALLGIAFLIKAAIWPMGFWLSRTYAAAMPPVAAMFALMTKVGIYVLLRLDFLVFGSEAGAQSAHFGDSWLLWGGILTVIAGTIGILSAKSLGRLIGNNVIISSGTLLGAIAFNNPTVTAGLLAYLVISVLALASFFLINGLLIQETVEQPANAIDLEPYANYAYSGHNIYAKEDETRPSMSTPLAITAASFFAGTLLLAGLPPLSGFIAKFALLAPMANTGTSMAGWLFFSVIIIASFAMIIVLCRAGIQLFWDNEKLLFPLPKRSEIWSISALIGICLVLSFSATAPLDYLQQTAIQIHQPLNYIQSVLTGEP